MPVQQNGETPCFMGALKKALTHVKSGMEMKALDLGQKRFERFGLLGEIFGPALAKGFQIAEIPSQCR
jgi:hypothetical protein